MLARMLDCEATIMAVQRVYKSNESAGLRAEQNYLLEKLYNAQQVALALRYGRATVNAQQQIASPGGVEEDSDSEQGDFERTDSEESDSEEDDFVKRTTNNSAAKSTNGMEHGSLQR
ncbi:hypothetical protein L207DRAFT_586644 [Hyaloscypha variabilis F]|uniref:Uncharacterized protein n=1 Tax=Hyaloscypha variabilis (strain UAMH 11265 / GT02V1 / F) TaxID=1149755 RepID=A0A2J6REL2_HYAVF|nr:hypothetical protein L207DRAFT_586644 [Hyaloscypha variabilis F]